MHECVSHSLTHMSLSGVEVRKVLVRTKILTTTAAGCTRTRTQQQCLDWCEWRQNEDEWWIGDCVCVCACVYVTTGSCCYYLVVWVRLERKWSFLRENKNAKEFLVFLKITTAIMMPQVYKTYICIYYICNICTIIACMYLQPYRKIYSRC